MAQDPQDTAPRLRADLDPYKDADPSDDDYIIPITDADRAANADAYASLLAYRDAHHPSVEWWRGWWQRIIG